MSDDAALDAVLLACRVATRANWQLQRRLPALTSPEIAAVLRLSILQRRAYAHHVEQLVAQEAADAKQAEFYRNAARGESDSLRGAALEGEADLWEARSKLHRRRWDWGTHPALDMNRVRETEEWLAILTLTEPSAGFDLPAKVIGECLGHVRVGTLLDLVFRGDEAGIAAQVVQKLSLDPTALYQAISGSRELSVMHRAHADVERAVQARAQSGSTSVAPGSRETAATTRDVLQVSGDSVRLLPAAAPSGPPRRVAATSKRARNKELVENDLFSAIQWLKTSRGILFSAVELARRAGCSPTRAKESPFWAGIMTLRRQAGVTRPKRGKRVGNYRAELEPPDPPDSE